MVNIWASLQGKKTYIVVGVFLGLVALEKFAGIDIPKFDVGANWLEDVMIMLGFGAVRAAK